MTLSSKVWQTLFGDPITGKTPPVLHIMNDVTPTQEQLNMVAHHYRLLEDMKKVAIVPCIVQERTLTDGTRIRMVSNYGVDTVMVWPAGISGVDEIAPSGIGVCFTNKDGSPINGWSYEDDKKNKHPHPYILMPKRKILESGEIVSTGEWVRTPVKALLGGQRLWVSKDRKMWQSSLSAIRDIYPRGRYYNVGIQKNYYPLTVEQRWMPAWVDLIGYTDIGTPISDGKCLCLFRRNDTTMLAWQGITEQASIRDMELSGKKRRVIHITEQNDTLDGINIHREIYRTQNGMMRNPYAEWFNVLVQQESIKVIYKEPGTYNEPSHLSVHPDGERVICLATQNNYKDLVLVTVRLDEEPTYTLTPLEPDSHTVSDDGTAQWSVKAEYFPRFWSHTVQRLRTDGQGGFEYIPITELRPYGSVQPPPDGDGNYGFHPTGEANTIPRVFAATFTRTAGGAWTRDVKDKHINRYYFAVNGDTVVEKVSSEDKTTVTSSFLSVHTVDPGDYLGPYGGAAQVDTFTLSASSNITRTGKTTIDLGKRSLVVEDVLSTANTQYEKNTTGVRHMTAYSPMQVTLDSHLTYIGRDILFYDHVTGTIFYFEYKITASAVGSGNPNSYYNGFAFYYDMNNLLEISASGKFVLECNGAVVFSYDTVIPNGNLNKSMLVGTLEWSGDGDYGNPSAQPSVDFSLLDMSSQAQNSNIVVNTPQSVTAQEPITAGGVVTPTDTVYNWNNITISNETATPKIRTGAINASLDSTKSPSSFINVAYARDPVTFAVILQASFNGKKVPGDKNTDEEWTFAIDNTGVKQLKDVEMVDALRPGEKGNPKRSPKLPADATLYRKAQINSLVSI